MAFVRPLSQYTEMRVGAELCPVRFHNPSVTAKGRDTSLYTREAGDFAPAGAGTGVTDCHDQSADWSRNDSVGANGCKGRGGEK